MWARLRRLVLFVAFVVLVVQFWRGLGTLAGVVVAAFVAAYITDRWRKRRAVKRFRARWRDEGKDLLLVYSNSPNWQRYVEETWLPRWGDRAVVLNWSERSTWQKSRPEVALFRAFAGVREFNPLAIVVPPKGRHVAIVRFWLAFRDFKHGKDRLLRAAETELGEHLAASSQGGTAGRGVTK